MRSIFNQFKVDAAKKLGGAAEFFFRHTETNNNKIQFEHLFQKALIACGNVIVALGVRDLFDQPDGPYDAFFKIQKLFLVIQAYQLFYQIAVALLGVKMGTIVIGSLLVLITILSIVYPYISPFPHNLLNEVQNWTYKAKCGDLPKVEGRAEEKHQVATHLENGDNVLVVGKSGVGKTKMLQKR